jgi:hypothetical protein
VKVGQSIRVQTGDCMFILFRRRVIYSGANRIHVDTLIPIIMPVIKHRIKAYLYDNPLTKEDVENYVARVKNEK